jgi:hypothetical protein
VPAAVLVSLFPFVSTLIPRLIVFLSYRLVLYYGERRGASVKLTVFSPLADAVVGELPEELVKHKVSACTYVLSRR